MNDKRIARDIYIGVVLFCLAVIIISLYSCSPYKKLQDRKPKNEKEKSQLAAACVENFPSKTDTLTEYKTDTVIIDNTEERNQLNSIIDSLIIEKSKIEQDTALISQLQERLVEALNEDCPPAKVVTKKEITTITKPDAAKEFLLNQRIDQLKRDSTLLTYERDASVKAKNDIIDKQEVSISYNLKMAGVALLHKWWFYLVLAVGGALLYFKVNPYLLGKTLLSKFIFRKP